jgi:hypothetical protein
LNKKHVVEELQEEDAGGVLEEESGNEAEIPAWARTAIPQGMKIPPGKQLSFLRFKSEWTDAPEKGNATTFRRKKPGTEGDAVAIMEDYEALSRVLVTWPLTVAEERLALKRARGEVGRASDELAMQMIRGVDGKRIDWTGEWAKNADELEPAERLWNEIGPKCRPLVINLYRQLHTLKAEELVDFFVDCLVVARPTGG